MTTAILKYFKVNPHASVPTYGSHHAACFDLRACLLGIETVKTFTPTNAVEDAEVTQVEDENGKWTASFTLKPMHRALIPTGLIFDLPPYYSLRAHPRSGMALKHGITLINAEGVIDPDYVEESFIPVINLTDVPFVANHNDRIIQAELQYMDNMVSHFIETKIRPKAVGNRAGGFGSTGK